MNSLNTVAFYAFAFCVGFLLLGLSVPALIAFAVCVVCIIKALREES